MRVQRPNVAVRTAKSRRVVLVDRAGHAQRVYRRIHVVHSDNQGSVHVATRVVVRERHRDRQVVKRCPRRRIVVQVLMRARKRARPGTLGHRPRARRAVPPIDQNRVRVQCAHVRETAVQRDRAVLVHRAGHAKRVDHRVDVVHRHRHAARVFPRVVVPQTYVDRKRVAGSRRRIVVQVLVRHAETPASNRYRLVVTAVTVPVDVQLVPVRRPIDFWVAVRPAERRRVVLVFRAGHAERVDRRAGVEDDPPEDAAIGVVVRHVGEHRDGGKQVVEFQVKRVLRVGGVKSQGVDGHRGQQAIGGDRIVDARVGLGLTVPELRY